MTRYYAVAELGDRAECTVVVVRGQDGHQVWGDTPILAATPEDMPAAAAERLTRTYWRVTDEWTRTDDARVRPS
jgi:hypothetical protein